MALITIVLMRGIVIHSRRLSLQLHYRSLQTLSKRSQYQYPCNTWITNLIAGVHCNYPIPCVFYTTPSDRNNSTKPAADKNTQEVQSGENSGGALKRGWRYAVTVVKSFIQGMRLIIADIKKVRQLKRQMGGFKISGEAPVIEVGEINKVTWEDIQFIYKSIRDLKRTLPTIVLFWIPLIGYVAPFIALMFPNRLLSSHFWSENQKKQFEEKNLKQRHDNMIKLRIYLTEKTTELNKYLLDHLVKIENKLVSQSLDWDWKTQEQVLGMGLNKLPNKQLKLVSHSWGIRSVLPISWWLRRKLRKHLDYIFTCDHLIFNQGINNIEGDKLKELLLERGILSNELQETEIQTVLNQWLLITTANKKSPHLLIGHLPLAWTKL